MSMSAEIISVGTELLLGEIVNSNAQMLSQGLSEMGINVFFHTAVGDNKQRLREIIDLAKSRSDIIITTGGLGPTYDDLTKEVVAESFGKKLTLHEDSHIRVMDFFRQAGTTMTPNNRSQALIPQGSEVLINDWGTAPGVAFKSGGKYVIMLPGPPAECSMMFLFRVIPYLERITKRIILSKSIRVFGMGESAVDNLLGKMMFSMQNPTVAPYAKMGEVLLRVTASATTKDDAVKLIDPVVDEILAKLGSAVYGIDVESLEEVVAGLLKQKKLTVAVAESCTGGLLAKRITDIPGVSDVFLGGICAYDNSIKTKLLGVKPEVLESEGEVSKTVVAAMAEGVRKATGADIGIATTGLAGPGGKTNPSKPIGTVFIAISSEDYNAVNCFSLWGNRQRIRNTASSHALNMLRFYLIS